MNILIIAKYELIRNLRDIKMMVILILFPILTIFILGNVQPDSASDPISVGYVNLDKSNDVGAAFDQFIKSDEIKDMINIVSYDSLDSVNETLDKGDISCFIYLSDDLTDNLKSGDTAKIMVDGNKNVDFIDSLVTTFISTLKTTSTIALINGNDFEINSDKFAFQRISTKEGKGQPDAIDYYSIVMLLEMLIIGAIFGVFISSSPQNSDINIRLYSMPIDKVVFMVGRTIGSIGCLFLSAMTTLLFSKYVYGANWNGNIILIIGVILIYSAIIVGMGIIIGMFVSSYTTALSIVMLLMIVFGIVSGAVTPGSSVPGLNYFTPNYHAQTLLLGTIYGYSMDIILEGWIGLMIFFVGIYAFVIGIIRRRKNAHI